MKSKLTIISLGLMIIGSQTQTMFRMSSKLMKPIIVTTAAKNKANDRIEALLEVEKRKEMAVVAKVAVSAINERNKLRKTNGRLHDDLIGTQADLESTVGDLRSTVGTLHEVVETEQTLLEKQRQRLKESEKTRDMFAKTRDYVVKKFLE